MTAGSVLFADDPSGKSWREVLAMIKYRVAPGYAGRGLVRWRRLAYELEGSLQMFRHGGK